MKIEVINEIYNTVDFMYEFIMDKMESFDSLRESLRNFDNGYWYSAVADEAHDGKSFDFAVRNMGFTMYKNEDGSARLGDNATLYIRDDAGDVVETVNVELYK